MSFGFNSQMGESKYAIQIETDNREQFLFMQEMARECVDGKHKKNENDGYTEDGLKYCSCGHKPKCFNRKFNDGNDDWAVWCEHCDKMVISLDKRGAIMLWNHGFHE